MHQLDLHISQHIGSTVFQVSQQITLGSLGIWGPSGAGKSSFLKMIAGLHKPLSGSMTWNGTSWFQQWPLKWTPLRRRPVGFCFQDNRLFPHFSVDQQLQFFRQPDLDSSEYNKILETLGLDSLLSQKTSQLSGGEARRVSLACALVRKPELLILDEPFTGIDQKRVMQAIDLIQILQRNWQFGLLLASHHLNEILAFGQEIMLLDGSTQASFGNWANLLCQMQLPALHQCPIENVIWASRMAQGEPIVVENEHLFLGPAALPDAKCFKFLAQDVILARNKIENISVRNQIPGRISQILPAPWGHLLALDAGQTIWAIITEETQAHLHFEVGEMVYGLIKAMALQSVDDVY
ncbi:MAG: ATP-binding cassette domain-containing protein [Acidobacteria bacterium]|nr:ATP-binding cassette domain-containing protein [Acidobacteriota bacterium]